MNNQEYEQKKRECWEELWDEISGNIDFAPGVDDRMKEHIYDTFDRAFALGREKETITQEEIEKAAKKYAAEVDKNVRDLYGIEEQPASLTFGECAAESFREGAKFALGKQEKDVNAVAQCWAARDKSGDLYIYTCKPERIINLGYWGGNVTDITPSNDLFPELTWESDPLQVEITIKRKKK